MSELKSDDFLLLNREGVDYKITIADLAEYLQEEPDSAVYEVRVKTEPTVDKTRTEINTVAKASLTEYELIEVVTRGVEPPKYFYRWEVCDNDYVMRPATDWKEYDGTQQDVEDYTIDYVYRINIVTKWEYNGETGTDTTRYGANVYYPIVSTGVPIVRSHKVGSREIDMDVPLIHNSGNKYDRVRCHWTLCAQADTTVLDGIDPIYETDRPMCPINTGRELSNEMGWDGTPEGFRASIPDKNDDYFWNKVESGYEGIKEGELLILRVWFQPDSNDHAYTLGGCIAEAPGKPWDGFNGGIFHVKNATGFVPIKANGGIKAWNVDGTNERYVTHMAPGEEFVFCPPDTANLFGPSDANWEFGDLTDTSKVTTMESLFEGCEGFNSDISWWDTSKVTNMESMFRSCQEFNLPLNGWDTSKVTNMRGMFANAQKFNSDISKWNTWKVENMDVMFADTRAFNVDIGEWNTSQCSEMDGMFVFNDAFIQDLSLWCVGGFGGEPMEFCSGSPFDEHKNYHPKWGTCPRGEDQ
jgi:surface protein